MRFDRFLRKNPRVYLDYGAATPVRREVYAAMRRYFDRDFANAGGIHTEATNAKTAIAKARAQISKLLEVRAEGVVFTSGGTEANNIAIVGLATALQSEGRAYTDMHVVTTAIEHPSILESVRYLEGLGVQVSYVPVDELGVIDVSQLEALLTNNTVLVSFAYANSEIGTIQPVSKITRLVKKYNQAHNVHIYTHLDAAQAPLWLPCSIAQLGVDVLTFDAGKCEGPKGVGVLAMRHGVQLHPVSFGGGQEFGIRPGTENTPLIVGCAESFALAQEGSVVRTRDATYTSEKLWEALQEIPGAVLNGPEISEQRLANNINISIPGLDAELTVVTLDEAGFAASTRSACGAASSTGSHVVRTISDDEKRASSTVRFTHGGQVPSRSIKKIVTTLVELQSRQNA